jgi:hypothetical protein
VAPVALVVPVDPAALVALAAPVVPVVLVLPVALVLPAALALPVVLVVPVLPAVLVLPVAPVLPVALALPVVLVIPRRSPKSIKTESGALAPGSVLYYLFFSPVPPVGEKPSPLGEGGPPLAAVEEAPSSRRSGKGSLVKESRKGIPFGLCRPLGRLRIDLAVAMIGAAVQWRRVSTTTVILSQSADWRENPSLLRQYRGSRQSVEKGRGERIATTVISVTVSQ